MKFNSWDFSECYKWADKFGSPDEAIAACANEVFQRWLDTQPIIYGNANGGRILYGWGSGILPGVTHRARLVCVEEIKPKECSHEPTLMQDGSGDYTSAICKHCGIRLKLAWKAEEL